MATGGLNPGPRSPRPKVRRSTTQPQRPTVLRVRLTFAIRNWAWYSTYIWVRRVFTTYDIGIKVYAIVPPPMCLDIHGALLGEGGVVGWLVIWLVGWLFGCLEKGVSWGSEGG